MFSAYESHKKYTNNSSRQAFTALLYWALGAAGYIVTTHKGSVNLTTFLGYSKFEKFLLLLEIFTLRSTQHF